MKFCKPILFLVCATLLISACGLPFAVGTQEELEAQGILGRRETETYPYHILEVAYGTVLLPRVSYTDNGTLSCSLTLWVSPFAAQSIRGTFRASEDGGWTLLETSGWVA